MELIDFTGYEQNQRMYGELPGERWEYVIRAAIIS